jgi:hypothetical protein
VHVKMGVYGMWRHVMRGLQDLEHDGGGLQAHTSLDEGS